MASIQIGQIVVREKGQRTCAHHRGQLLILYCETCDDVICVKCLSSIHKSHTVCELSEVIPAKKTDLQNHLDKNNRAQIKQYVDFTEIEMKKNSSSFDSLCRDVKAQSIKLKQAIDTKTEEVLSACKEMEEGNIKALTNFRRELQSRLEYFDDDFHAECAAVLRDGSDLQVHDTLEEVRAKAKVPLIPILGTASFSPNTNPHSFMDRYFGTLTTSAHRPPGQYKLLPKAIEQSSYKNKEISRQLQQLLQDAVYELDVSMKSPESLLRTRPSIEGTRDTRCICVTMDDQVLVGGMSKITKYTKDGRALISTQPRQCGDPLVPSPRKIAECCVTRNVAAISSGSRSVIVMNTNLEKIFQNNGNIPEGQRKELGIGSCNNMFAIQYDTTGNLIICCDSYFHILSGSGEFLKAITLSWPPNTIKRYLQVFALDNDGLLWTWCSWQARTKWDNLSYIDSGIIKRLQYKMKNES
ncbi:uncharacterized protein [Argopecten irradians]|uniref:uncharacterized protein n=1 Tax=Argopecten irradians TaxID=31199 RepID=UPI00371BCD3F